MVRLRVLVAAMLGTGLIGLGIGYLIGQRSFIIDNAAGGIPAPLVCSITVPKPVGDTLEPTRSSYPCLAIRVPQFSVQGGQNNLIAGAEAELTDAVVKAINSRTAYKVVPDGDADMELTGAITDFCSRGPAGGLHEGSDIREDETHLVVQLTWKDLHTGESLLATRDGSRPATVELRSIAYWRPELGEPIELPRRENLERMADQVVLMMDTPTAK
jgi:hypothetical protein